MVQNTVDAEGMSAEWTLHLLHFDCLLLHIEEESIFTQWIRTLHWDFLPYFLLLFFFGSRQVLLSEVLLFEGKEAIEVLLFL